MQTGKEIKTITWDDLGFRTFFYYRYTQMSDCGRYFLIRKENPRKHDINDWQVAVPDGMEQVIYDTETNTIIDGEKKNARGAAFNMDMKLFAYIKTDYDENNKFLIKKLTLIVRGIKA